MRDESWATGASAALLAAAQGVAAVTEERRGTTLRDTRSIARRLGTSAVALFAQRGFDDVKVSEIAAHAGVTSRTFFRYFPSKETVILDIWDQTNARLMELIETVGQPEAEVLPTLTEAVVTWCREYGDLFAALAPMTEQSETLMAAVNLRTVVWEDHLADALRVRYPELDEMDAKVWSSTTMALLRLFQRTAPAHGLSYAEAAQDVFDRLAALTSRNSSHRITAGSRPPSDIA
ncbi:TetR/AcrR family transcriptional regulator [Streptomyces ossamyceticus]|uniref:TetR family transcriptional regulator n=1 Tax=Streptomyces ossamyceticus TaxID=249581 RepID=A0ABV2V7E6_9ACTN